MKPDGRPCELSLRDAQEIARILEGLGRRLWEAGVRDEQPHRVEFEPAGARWKGLFEVHRRGDRVVLQLEKKSVDVPLVPLVALIQVLDWLA